MRPDTTWQKVPGLVEIDAHETMERLAVGRARGEDSAP
jgi:hypothetical protein